MDDLFSPEIAELEQFIDSYVKDDHPTSEAEQKNVSSPKTEPDTSVHVFGNDVPEEYKFDGDFQQELLEHQRNQVESNDPVAQLPGFETWNMSLGLNRPNEYLPLNQHSTPQFHDGPMYQEDWRDMGRGHQNVHHPANGPIAAHYGLPTADGIRPGRDMPYVSVIPEWVDTSKPPPPLPWAPQDNARNNHAPNGNNRMPGQAPGSNAMNGPDGHLQQWNGGRPPKQHSPRGAPMQNTSPRQIYTSQMQKYPNNPNNRRDDNSHKGLARKKTPDKKPTKSSPSNKTKNDGSPGNGSHRSPTNTNDGSPCSRNNSQSSSSDGGGSHRSKVVSGRSKAEVRSWLTKDSDTQTKTSMIERKMGEMEISKDLPKFIKLAQSYISDDKKLREVAQMLCNKAIRNPKFGEKSAILCNEMSNHKVLGTKFRSAVLSVIQTQFKNRHHLIETTTKNPSDLSWVGFVTFLVELYENLRTQSGERLKILVTPVYDCFFLMLKEKKLTVELGGCLYINLSKVGRVLEKSSEDKMSELIAEIRDKCVMASPTPAVARRYLLQSLEMYARGWSVPLDKEYFDQCSDKQMG